MSNASDLTEPDEPRPEDILPFPDSEDEPSDETDEEPTPRELYHNQDKKSDYDRGDHRLAYETWKRTHNWTRTAKAVGNKPSMGLTIRNWAKETYKCKEGCPFHGWERLEAEDAKAMSIKLRPIEEVTEDVRMQTTVEARQEALERVFRSDIERLTHWEAIYAKQFYHIMGIPLSIDRLVTLTDNVKSSAELIDRYETGLKPRDLGDAVRTLALIQEKIQTLRRDAGLYTKGGLGPTAESRDKLEGRELSIEDLRTLKEIWESTPLEKRDALSRLFLSEQATLGFLGIEPSE